eukprot:14848-Pelagococcus_subviridis.AAC.4
MVNLRRSTLGCLSRYAIVSSNSVTFKRPCHLNFVVCISFATSPRPLAVSTNMSRCGSRPHPFAANPLPARNAANVRCWCPSMTLQRPPPPPSPFSDSSPPPPRNASNALTASHSAPCALTL